MPAPTPVESPPPAPERPDDAHKGTFGTVIVVGGSATMLGAPALCATAAFRGGAGLVKLATPADILPFCIAVQPSATGIALDRGNAAAAALDAADPDREAVLAVGPGMGKSDWAGELVGRLLRDRRRMVLDADGLNLLAMTGEPRPDSGPPLVMTPHPGEFKRLAEAVNIDASGTDAEQRPRAATELARAHRTVVVLKGRHTIVADGERFYRNTTGNAAMATAGTGDVLTGIIASLMAQRLEPFDAAVLGVYLHGLAGNVWRQRRGTSGMMAMDLAELLPEAFEHHRAAHSRQS